VIRKKRDGGELTQPKSLPRSTATRAAIPDYQASAWLMAVLLKA
jgi:thymidine phosphorylase